MLSEGPEWGGLPGTGRRAQISQHANTRTFHERPGAPLGQAVGLTTDAYGRQAGEGCVVEEGRWPGPRHWEEGRARPKLLGSTASASPLVATGHFPVRP